MATPPSLLTIKQFAQRHPAFTEASLRWLRFKSPANGFGPAFLKVGKRVLVWEEEFFRIVENQNLPGTSSVAAGGQTGLPVAISEDRDYLPSHEH